MQLPGIKYIRHCFYLPLSSKIFFATKNISPAVALRTKASINEKINPEIIVDGFILKRFANKKKNYLPNILGIPFSKEKMINIILHIKPQVVLNISIIPEYVLSLFGCIHLPVFDIHQIRSQWPWRWSCYIYTI